uniref:Uncharacterized protein n=1 Tax=Magallana gigas TaxID=29159 RepID=K1S1Y2_MAGGI
MKETVANIVGCSIEDVRVNGYIRSTSEQKLKRRTSDSIPHGEPKQKRSALQYKADGNYYR